MEMYQIIDVHYFLNLLGWRNMETRSLPELFVFLRRKSNVSYWTVSTNLSCGKYYVYYDSDSQY
jgi:hypothetical protein